MTARMIIAAPMSGSGKTTVTAGLIAALAARGLRVAPFKAGPDYIDPSYHQRAAGRPCHNLDAWMLEEAQVAGLLARHSRGADIALIEGVMGLFDGVGGRDDAGSAAHLARITGTPVLLVIDAWALARTAAALAQGLRDFDPRVRVAGVILNRVGGAGHAALIGDALEERGGPPLLGYIPHDEALRLPERHLGLVPTAEPGQWQDWIDRARAQVEATVDLERVLELARTAAPLAAEPAPAARLCARTTAPVIAVARDAAFSFLYEDNLDQLRDAGARVEFFSPLADANLLAGAGAVYLCGGFPELYAAELAANAPMLGAIRAAAARGLPIYAECGGLMYLTEAIVDQGGVAHALAGVLPGRSVMTGRLSMGYRTVRAQRDSWLWRAGEQARGHEFHYSTWDGGRHAAPAAYTLLPGELQPAERPDGALVGNLLASYVHLQFRAFPALAERFVIAAAAASL